MFIDCTVEYKPIFCDFRRIDCISLYNTCFRSVLPYTANCDVVRQFAFLWTIAAIAEKQTEAVFADFRRFPANMGEYPFLTSKRLYGQIMALYGKLCRFAVCPIVSEYPFQAVRLSGCPVSADIYVNLPTCPLEYYVNRSDPLENSWLRSIGSDWSGSGRISGRQKIAL